ncbi:MAG: glycosyltransferase family 61 protein [Coleofasciculus sp. A1-SPW-01]|uniref:glycosyltransferase family 61 protein n=1 Tax=Coleofasciculus sp. A1-SPW-01 TaxID=3070819 RepID=UPI0032F30F70
MKTSFIKNIIVKNIYKIAKSIKSILFPLSLPSPEDLFPNTEKLYPIHPETVATPEVKQMHLARCLDAIHSDHYTVPPIHTVHLSKVIYAPRYGRIYTESGKPINTRINKAIHLYSFKSNKILDFITKANIDFTDTSHFVSRTEISQSKKIPGVCSTIMLIGRLENNQPGKGTLNHYHTLIDRVPRLYLLNQPAYENIDEIKLLYPIEPSTKERFFIERLAPKNVKISVVENLDSIYLIDKLIYPTLMSNQDCGYLPSAYVEYFRDKVLPKRESKKVNRIFISRSKAKKRKIINEDELFEALKPYGFKKYFLEDMPLESEIELFYDADYVVGSFGAGLTNIIFADQTKVLEIFPNHYAYTHYYYLSKSLKHTYGYYHGIEEKHSVATREEMTGNVDFQVDVRVNVSEVIERLLELENQHQLRCSLG